MYWSLALYISKDICMNILCQIMFLYVKAITRAISSTKTTVHQKEHMKTPNRAFGSTQQFAHDQHNYSGDI